MKLSLHEITSEKSESRNILARQEPSKISFLDNKTRLTLNTSETKSSKPQRLKVDYCNFEYDESIGKSLNKKDDNKHQMENNNYLMSPTRISKKKAARVIDQLKEASASKILSLKRLKDSRHFKSNQNLQNEDNISIITDKANDHVNKTDISLSKYLTTSTSALRYIGSNNKMLKYEVPYIPNQAERAKDFERFEKKTETFVKSKKKSLFKNIMSKTIKNLKNNIESEINITETNEIRDLKSEIYFMKEEVDRYRVENLELKMNSDLLSKKINILTNENDKLRNRYEENAKNLMTLNKFKDQIEKFEELFPNTTLESLIKRLKESEGIYLNVVKELNETKESLALAGTKANIKEKDLEEKALDLSKRKTFYENSLKDLGYSLERKDQELSKLEEYKESYLGLSNRLIGLFANWQSKNNVFVSKKTTTEEVSLRNPLEIMKALETLVEISTPESSQQYIRRFLVELNILQRKIFGDIERDKPDIPFIFNKIWMEFKKLRSQNQEFLKKTRDQKRQNTLIQRTNTEPD